MIIMKSTELREGNISIGVLLVATVALPQLRAGEGSIGAVHCRFIGAPMEWTAAVTAAIQQIGAADSGAKAVISAATLP